MDKDTYFKELQSNFDFGIELMKRKNHDYAGDQDPFKNFKASELIGLTVEQGILLRLTDKLARLSNLLKRKAMVQDESFADTAIDAMNYLNILLVYHQSQYDVDSLDLLDLKPGPVIVKGDNGRKTKDICEVEGCFGPPTQFSFACASHLEQRQMLKEKCPIGGVTK